MKEFLSDLKYRFYTCGIRRLIPKYHDRTIFTAFFWRTLRDRKTKGFDETDTWGLYYNLAKLIAPRLDMFIEYANICTPGYYVNDVESELLLKGKPYDKVWHRMANKRDRDYVKKESNKRWIADLKKMRDAFADVVEEDDDYEKWENKYKKQIETCAKRLQKLGTFQERKDYWESLGAWREYNDRIFPMAVDFAHKIRKEGLTLFAKHFQMLWW